MSNFKELYETELDDDFVAFAKKLEDKFLSYESEIKEITEDSFDYKPNYERYKAFKGKKYKVKLVMSEEYTIEADNPSEAEEIARDKFGNNYLIDDVIVTEV